MFSERERRSTRHAGKSGEGEDLPMGSAGATRIAQEGFTPEGLVLECLDREREGFP